MHELERFLELER